MDNFENKPQQNLEPVGFFTIIKAAYSNRPIGFWFINLFCFFIFFFVLDKNTGGSFGMRLLIVSICIIVGGFAGTIWSMNREGSRVSWFRYGSGILLTLLTIMLWSANGKTDANGNYQSPHDGYRSSGSNTNSVSYMTCPHCSGLGCRTNSITGEFKSCSSCGGDGKVTQEQYNRLSK